MNDAERLDEIRTRIKRINGKPELNAKQWQAVRALVQEYDSITDPGGLDKFFRTLKGKNDE